MTNLAEASPERVADGIAEILDPKLTVAALRPIDDREPQITARLSRLLDDARSGALDPAQFAYVRAGFFPGVAKGIPEQLRTLGPLQKLVLVERTEKGDDRIFTYEVAFASRVMYYRVGLATADRVSRFQLRKK